MIHIEKAEYIISSPSIDKCPAADKPEYAFIGRSNVGKSSLINMLTNKQKLAKTSNTPGKTQIINHFEIKNILSPSPLERAGVRSWYMVDLPGYGFAKVSQQQRKQWEKMIAGYLKTRSNLVMTFALIDARHTPQAIDIAFINKLGEWKVPFALIFTKTDKVQVEVFTNKLEANIIYAKNPLDAIEEYTTYSGRMRALPNWIQEGAVIGMQGGTDKAYRVWKTLKDAGTPISAFWLQDWIGQRTTLVGKQFWWNWELDNQQYPKWNKLVDSFLEVRKQY